VQQLAGIQTAVAQAVLPARIQQHPEHWTCTTAVYSLFIAVHCYMQCIIDSIAKVQLLGVPCNLLLLCCSCRCLMTKAGVKRPLLAGTCGAEAS
jgi:hypothetical protein